MSTSANGALLLLGRGKLYFDRFDSSGAPTGLRFLGDCDKLELTPSVQTKDRFSSSKKAATKLANVVVSQTHTLSIQMLEYDPENVALAFLGDASALSQTTSTVTAEALTPAGGVKLGRIYQTAKRNISAVSVKKGATTGVEGTDFEIEDAGLGLIRILPTSAAFVDSDALTVDYSAGTVTATQVAAGLEAGIDGKLVFVGDPANGPIYDVQFWHVRFTPSGALALITDDFGAIPLTGEVLDDAKNHPTAPLYLAVKR